MLKCDGVVVYKFIKPKIIWGSPADWIEALILHKFNWIKKHVIDPKAKI